MWTQLYVANVVFVIDALLNVARAFENFQTGCNFFEIFRLFSLRQDTKMGSRETHWKPLITSERLSIAFFYLVYDKNLLL